MFVDCDAKIFRCIYHFDTASVGGEGCEVVYGEGDWCVHMHYTCLVEIELHTVLAGVLLECSEHFLKNDNRFRE